MDTGEEARPVVEHVDVAAKALVGQQGGPHPVHRRPGRGEHLAVRAHEGGGQRVGRLGQREADGGRRSPGVEPEQAGRGHRPGHVVDVGPHLPVVRAEQHGCAQPSARLVGRNGGREQVGAGGAERLTERQRDQHCRVTGVGGEEVVVEVEHHGAGGVRPHRALRRHPVELREERRGTGTALSPGDGTDGAAVGVVAHGEDGAEHRRPLPAGPACSELRDVVRLQRGRPFRDRRSRPADLRCHRDRHYRSVPSAVRWADRPPVRSIASAVP